MKKYYAVALMAILMLALCLASAAAFVRGFYFSGAVLLAAAAVTAYAFAGFHRRLLRKMHNMISRIQYGDMSITFPEAAKGVEGDLNRSMNMALAAFRSRLYHAIASEAEMEAWQKLIRVLAHEMMNSLAPIISLSETMSERGQAQRRPDEKEYAVMLEAMQSIHRRSTGLLHFVENYRKLTRIPEPMKQYFTVRELFGGLEGLMDDEGMGIEFAAGPAGLKLYADRSQIEQVVLNLLRNAVEATAGQRDARITAEAWTDNGKTYVAVKDNGPGILPESMDKIFIPFYTTRQTGSGIGLSLSRQIMNRHNGTITVDSEPGSGSVFTLIFG